MTERIIQEVPLLDLLRALDASVDCNGNPDDFPQLMDTKLENAWTGYSGASALLDGEPQNKPIAVCVNGNEFYGDKYDWIVGNGNHRLATLIAMCAETVLVVFTEDRKEYMLEDVTGW